MVEKDAKGKSSVSGHAVQTSSVGTNHGTVINKVERIGEINVHCGSIGSESDQPANITFNSSTSGDQKIVLQLPDNAETALKIIEGMFSRGLIENKPITVEAVKIEDNRGSSR